MTSRPFVLGAVFQHALFDADPEPLRAYMSGLEQIGIEQVVAYDHVVGAGLDTRPFWEGAYSADDTFHEPFTLFSYLAGISRLQFATCVLVLPQRQTVLVAKQAAELQNLSGGRFRLGVGTGWNEVEYEGLGVPFVRRGARLNEQIELLRALWTQSTLTFEGKFHRVRDAGINPLPAVPVPLWVGGGASRTARRRIARFADGWMVPNISLANASEIAAQIRESCVQSGRDPATLDFEARLYLSRKERLQWREEVEGWVALGASRINLITDGLGIETFEQELEALADAADVLD